MAGDKISGEVGDDSKHTAIGKDIDQRANVVNNYLNRDAPKTNDERLDRIEVRQNETDRVLSRVVSLMDGDPSYRIIGIPDQLSAYIKVDQDWKRATEELIKNIDGRVKNIEGNKNIVIAPNTATLLIVIAVLALAAAFFALSWLQTAGPQSVNTTPLLNFFASIFVFLQGKTIWPF